MKLVFQLILLFFIFQTTYILLSTAIECESSNVAYTITVSPSGAGNFTTITNAINFIPSGNNQWIKIAISSGIYKEQIQIFEDKECIFLEGEGRDTTTITFDAHDVTATSITFSVQTDNFVAKGITFKNSYNRALHDMNPSVVPAVSLLSLGDKHTYYECGFVGYQDTLWDQGGRHYYHSCYIEGAVDFIWGAGQSVYVNCAINFTGQGFITAQGRNSFNDPGGYLFKNCTIFGTGYGCLGRAYGPFSRVIFMDSYFDANIDPQGWDIWAQQGHEGDITYAEYKCAGPGVDYKRRRVGWKKQLSDSEVRSKYTTKTFLNWDGWIQKQPRTISNIFTHDD